MSDLDQRVRLAAFDWLDRQRPLHGAVALLDADQTTLAVVMAGATAVHLALTFALGQRQ